MKFSDIPAHEEIKERLRTLVDTDRMPHALLIEGPAGTGKFMLARALAQYIHCENRDPLTDDSCGRCQACRLHETFNHIDTHYVFPVVKLEKMKTPPVSDDFIDEWKEFLAENPWMDFNKWTATFGKKNAQPIIYVTESEALISKLTYTTHISKYKIVVWWLPEKMNEDTSNKLLKLIEEPFEDTIFIMVSDNPRELLPTIYSRVQRVEVKRLSDDVVAHLLEQKYDIEPTDAMSIAHIAEGSMVTAENNVNESGESARFLQIFIELMRLAYQRKIKELRGWADRLSDMGREQEIRFYNYAMRLVRENFVYNYNVPEIVYMNRDEGAFGRNFARFINERNVERIMTVFNNAAIDLAGNGNGKFINLDVAIKIILLLKS